VDIANPRTFVSGRAVDILGIFDNRTGGAIIPLKGKQRLSEFPKQAASLSAWKSAMFFAYSHPLEGGETSVVKRGGARYRIAGNLTKKRRGGKDSRNFWEAEQPVARLWKPPSADEDSASSMMINERQPIVNRECARHGSLRRPGSFD